MIVRPNPTGGNIFAAVKTFDANIDNIGKFLSMFILSIQQEGIQSNANHPLTESMGYIKSEGM